MNGDAVLISAGYTLLWLSTFLYLLYGRSGERRWGVFGTISTTISWGLFTAGLVQRGLTAGHWPLTNAYEFALSFTWSIVSVYILLEFSWRERRTGPFVLLIAIAVATYAITRPEDDKQIHFLLPALRSIYLQIHVLSSSIGYGAFGLAAGLGLARLFQATPAENLENRSWLPESSALEDAMERAIALGFPWLSVGILTGAIWAQNAWGRYWGWDPKEVWALITWLWFTLLLHIRTLRNWRGRRLAWLVVGGFILVIFTFIGVPWLVRTVRLESLHGF